VESDPHGLKTAHQDILLSIGPLAFQTLESATGGDARGHETIGPWEPGGRGHLAERQRYNNYNTHYYSYNYLLFTITNHVHNNDRIDILTQFPSSEIDLSEVSKTVGGGMLVGVMLST